MDKGSVCVVAWTEPDQGWSSIVYETEADARAWVASMGHVVKEAPGKLAIGKITILPDDAGAFSTLVQTHTGDVT
jgi:hypothetical protein